MDDMDLYSALVGGAPTDPQRQAALAQALRQRAQTGNILQASGDRVIAPMGQQMVGESDRGAQQIAQEREKQQQLDTMEHYRQAEAGRFQQDLAEKAREANMTDARMRELAELASNTKLELKGAGGGKPMPNKEFDELSGMYDSLRGVKQTMGNFQPGYGGTGRNVENYIAAKLGNYAPDSMKNAQNFWANYGRQFTLPELKATIGVRHNQYMQQLFEQYHIDPNMADDQITKNLGQIHDQLTNRLKERVKALQSQGINIGGFEGFLSSDKAEGGPQDTSGKRPNPALQYLLMQSQVRGPQSNPVVQGNMFSNPGMQ